MTVYLGYQEVGINNILINSGNNDIVTINPYIEYFSKYDIGDKIYFVQDGYSNRFMIIEDINSYRDIFSGIILSKNQEENIFKIKTVLPPKINIAISVQNEDDILIYDMMNGEVY